MAQPRIVFIQSDGGLGRTAIGEDHISGLIVYATAATGALPGNGSRTWLGLKEAEAAGIIKGHASADVAHLWLQIRDFFRLHPGGILHTHFVQEPAGTQTFAEVATLQAFAAGKIRQFAIHVVASYSSTLMNALQTALTAQKAIYRPGVAAIGFGQYPATGSLADIHALTCPEIEVVMGHLDDPDEVFIGDVLEVDLSHKVNSVGLVLGAMSRANVGHSIAYVRNFNMAQNRTEGNLIVVNGSNDPAVLDVIHDKGYTFFKEFTGVPGVYLNLDQTATSSTSDYGSIRANRTAHKALRGMYAALVLEINAPVELNDDGTMDAGYVAAIEALASGPLEAMKLAGEISGYVVDVDPAQNVLSTSKLVIKGRILPLGCSSYLDVDLGYTVSISN